MSLFLPGTTQSGSQFVRNAALCQEGNLMALLPGVARPLLPPVRAQWLGRRSRGHGDRPRWLLDRDRIARRRIARWLTGRNGRVGGHDP